MLKYGFFNSVNKDRLYNASDMEKVFNLIVSNGIIANENGLSDSLKVKSSQTIDGEIQLKVCAGNGIFGGHWMEMTADEILIVPTPHTQYERIDSIVVRVDETERNITLKYLQGEAAESPAAPSIQRSNTIKEYRLANISVAANTTAITQSNITDTRPSADCGVVTNLLQNSDISSTYSQWESQFREFLAEKGAEFSAKLDEIGDIDADAILGLRSDVETIETKVFSLENTIDTTNSTANSMQAKLDLTAARTDANGVDIANLTSEVVNLKRDLSTPLWAGANVMGSGAIIRPSKKLSECKNGYIVVWCGYNSGAASNTRFNTFIVPKGMLSNISLERVALYCPIIYTHYDTGKFDQTMKQLLIYNDRIEGFTGNNADTLSSGMCLKFVFEY